ncbi:Replication factor C subunit 5 [Microtus ochrogaster]|uniref:Activator 1 subunit 5 n=1 Tax=Microtus ochrogaster TaxID=79684 RepID=A0A8J6KRV0_MICOH|nr:Replication factor C subunit 5 [Microtus ochrogaster]
MGLFQVEEPGDASTRTQDAADAPCISRLRATSPPPPSLGAETPAPDPEPEPRRGGSLQAPSPPAARAAGRGTAAPRPDRADSAPARPHPVDPPGPQPGDDRSERAAAELQPGLLTPDAATVRPPGEGEVVRSSPGDVPRELRRQEAALQPRLRLAHNAIGRRVCSVLRGLGATGRPANPHNALQGLEKKKDAQFSLWGITDLSATCELGPWRFSHSIPGDDVLSTIQKFISEDHLPHLLLYGPPGTGKTSTILACAKQLYKDKEFVSMVLELNASDDRGIYIVRGPILSFASKRTIFKKGFKLVILDEADAMTQDAQNALRRVIEKFTENTRFCLICNYLSKIIPALQSRCTRFRFGPLTPELMVPRLEHVIQQENVDISEDGMKALVTLSSGNMRRALNILQSTNMAFGKVREETVYTCTRHPLKTDIANILDWMLNQDFTTAYRNIMELKTLKGLALHDILTEVHLFVHRVDYPSSVRIHLLTKMADIEYRLSVGTNKKIQLSSLIAAFQVTRDQIVSEA